MMNYFRAPDAFIEDFDAVTDTLQPKASRSHWIRQAMVDFMAKHKQQPVTTTSKATITELFAKHGNGQAAECIAFVMFTAILWMGACAAVGGAFIDCWGVLADGHQ